MLQAVVSKNQGQQQLGAAFEQFNELSKQLSESYCQLENRVSELTAELSEVSRQRATALEENKSISARLNDLIDFLPGGVIVLNAEGIVEQCNPAAISLLGEPLKGERWLSVIKRSFLPRVDDGHEVSTVDGRRLGIATGAMQQQGQLILLTDLTQTRQLQEQVNRQERLASMGKMVSALAHQIRTPLSSAMLYASHLLNKDLPLEKRDQFSEKLSQRLQHMERQVRDMLLFVKGDLALNDRVFVSELEKALATEVEALPEAARIKCHWENTCALSVLRCNKDVLVGALMNTVNNATQANTSIVEMNIKFYQSKHNTLVISIHDNGPGMSEEQLKICQEAFVTTKTTGLGLGLNIVNIVTRAHGGEFQLSSSPMNGTCAKFELPLLENTH